MEFPDQIDDELDVVAAFIRPDQSKDSSRRRIGSRVDVRDVGQAGNTGGVEATEGHKPTRADCGDRLVPLDAVRPNPDVDTTNQWNSNRL